MADGPARLSPPVVVVAPVDPRDQPLADWNAVADSVGYPELARRARIEATVPATVRLDARGRAARVEVSSASAIHVMLRDAAEDGLKSAVYEPAQRGTNPFAGDVDVVVIFRSRLCGTPVRF
ncbi:TonB family protein [Rubricoccus marinus]|uniref:TonB family protein n=1 Tax=Rubricoccus marinus TaxID=716817 RepID=UPI0015C58BEF|nr:TonB family protein [Rubricoccus marinus]